ncbi:hypothetical protein GJW-30_1_00564 [Variibacter gotjawalensis]|uniref:Uncharacterized protein n=1 Tax=Variibacter gotjawalensis TaxID=1333996 RepID=A0A0S3PQ12_9BRAD|nr:hypothetical protein [Variibacter gotjawalensis]RZS50219.1 hypothetical protein EV661_2674 [Variibacter gotjawalensis]BAT58050.1 hypothetical protein GJW-30_1_00564 [Variibacter gotjawalensis]
MSNVFRIFPLSADGRHREPIALSSIHTLDAAISQARNRAANQTVELWRGAKRLYIVANVRESEAKTRADVAIETATLSHEIAYTARVDLARLIP